ncbi:MAG: response regulator [Spirochaetes bacterium]|nr:response regulator [Spirochaetota bacterium]
MKILAIDDEPIVRENIAAFLEDSDHVVIQAGDGGAGLELFRKESPDVVLCDLRMPRVDGLEVLEAIRRDSPETPIIMISGTGVIHDVIEALRLGAWDYIIKPIHDMGVLEHALNKAVERAALLRENRLYRENLEDEVKKRTQEILERTQEVELTNQLLKREISERRQVETRLKSSLTSLEKTMEGTITTISSIVDMRDPYTGGHQKHVAQLSRAIAVEMGLSDEQVRGIYFAGLIHDIGKLAVPIEVLVKPGAISQLEAMMIRTHAKAGWDILKEIEFPWPIAQIVLQHHERMNGSGYPEGLEGTHILREARIIAVADVVESMTFHRPYRPALGIEKALEEIQRGAGTLYDSEAAEACAKIIAGTDFRFA